MKTTISSISKHSSSGKTMQASNERHQKITDTAFKNFYSQFRSIYSNLFIKYFPFIIIAVCIALGSSLFRAFTFGWNYSYWIQIVSVIILLITRIFDNKRTIISAWIFTGLIAIHGIILLYTYGLVSVALLYLLVSLISFALFFGIRICMLSAFFYIVVLTVTAILVAQGIIPTRPNVEIYVKSYQAWVAQGTTFVFLSLYCVIIIFTIHKFLFGLVKDIKESESRYHSLFESANDAIFTMDSKRFIDCNAKALNMFGCTQAEIRNKSPIDFSPERQLDGMLSTEKAAQLINAALCGEPQRFEWRHIRLDSTPFDTEVSLNKINSNDSSLLLAIVRDITEQKKIKSEIIKSEAFRKRVFDTSRIPIVIMDAVTYKSIDCNPAATNIYRFTSREETLGKTPLDVSAKFQYDGTPSAEKAEFFIQKARDDGSVIFEWRHCRPDGEEWDAEVQLISFTLEGKELFQFSLLDITDRKRAEKQLHEEKMLSDAIINLLPGTFYLYEDGERLVRWNKNYELTNHHMGELQNISPTNVIAEIENKKLVGDMIQRILKEGEGHLELTRHVADGSIRSFLYTASRIEIGKKTYVIGIGQNITEIKTAIAATRESEERFRQIAENIEEVFFLLDKQSRQVLYVSPVIALLFGVPFDRILTNPRILVDSIHPDDRPSTRFADENARYTTELNEEFRIVREDGTTRWLRLRSFLIKNSNQEVYRVAGVVADITQQKEAQEKAQQQQMQLIQADKMASLGILISGVAHEINNPTNFITLNTPLLRRIFENVLPVLRKYVDENGDFSIGSMSFTQLESNIMPLIDGIANGASRIKHIVADLKEYARLDTSNELQRINLNQVITSSLSLVNHVIRKKTDNFVVTLSSEELWFRGSFQRIEQVIINLINNAVDALTSRSQKIKIDSSLNTDRKIVIVSISDEGIGIDPQNIKKITDPFFTTKRDSGGTGLGLSISAGIIKDHSGSLLFNSTPGKGTIATIELAYDEKLVKQ